MGVRDGSLKHIRHPCVALLYAPSQDESQMSAKKASRVHPNKHSHVSHLSHTSPVKARTRSIFFSKQRLGLFVFHYNTTRERDETRTGERKKRREGALFKEPGGRNLCGCGRNTPPTPFFFITEGKQGPHNHCLIITSMGPRCVLEECTGEGGREKSEERVEL